MAENVGASFSRLPGADPAARRASALLAQEWGSVKAGLITAVSSDHLVVQPFGENDKIRVDLAITGSVIAMVPPYMAGDTIACVKLKTPRVVDYEWIDLNMNARTPLRFYVKPMAQNIPMITQSINARSCSIALPIEDNFDDTNGTVLSAHYMDHGCGWFTQNASGNTVDNFTIQSNVASISSTTGSRVYCRTSDQTHDVQLDCVAGTITGGANHNILIQTLNRILDRSNYWYVAVRVRDGVANLGQDVVEVNSGTVTVRATSSQAISFGTTLAIKFNDDGNNMSLEVSGGASFTVTHASTAGASQTDVGFGQQITLGGGTYSTPTTFTHFQCDTTL